MSGSSASTTFADPLVIVSQMHNDTLINDLIAPVFKSDPYQWMGGSVLSWVSSEK